MVPTKGLRLHIGIFGRRNVGKSSLLNALTNQSISIVSDVAGTTTDPVEKAIEIQPLGPCQFIDTAGIDDEGDLGRLRVERTERIFERTDLGILVTQHNEWSSFEESIVCRLKKNHIPFVVVNNKIDQFHSSPLKFPHVTFSALKKEGIATLKQAMVEALPKDFFSQHFILGDLVRAGEIIVMVVPIDKEAPKGRIILPQVQAIRESLDAGAISMVVKETELAKALALLPHPPSLVVTDSQAFAQVSALVPRSVPLTSFSILFARFKGDLKSFVEGAKTIDRLTKESKVVILESCSHHPIENDIGRDQIPKLLAKKAGGYLDWSIFSGHDFPSNLADYTLAIQCGGCMTNRKEILMRILRCQEAGVPITNYGIALAHCNGILQRTLEPLKNFL